MIDKDLAEVYGVKTKRLNEQVRRNIERFPERFMFQLSDSESDKLVANCDRFLIIDKETAYSIGSSVKDAGKRCFAVTQINDKWMVKIILEKVQR